MEHVDVVIIGGGPAGMAAALGAWDESVRDVLVLDRDYHRLGGILNQCIHSGFGLQIFGEELTGPEYAQRYVDLIEAKGIRTMLGTMAIDLRADRTVTAVNPGGVHEIGAGAVVLAMGCRERPRGALNIPGYRPAGVFTAGTAQKFVNLDGFMPGREVVVLGSGDIGLIMARRMTLEGARVAAVAEILPYSNGLKRIVVQCLDDFDIPLLLSHTVTRIVGKERVTGVDIAKVDGKLNPLPETTRHIPCDTLLLSVGLIPENELAKATGIELSPVTGGAVVGESFQTSVEGIFACGNVLHVHDLADYVSVESELAGRNAARFVQGRRFGGGGPHVVPGPGVRQCVPFRVDPRNIGEWVDVRFRVSQVFVDRKVAVYFDQDCVRRRASRVLAPGEMGTIRIERSLFEQHPEVRTITVAVEEA